MKLQVGDRVEVCGVIGNIVKIYRDRRIGFHIFNRQDSYDILLSHVPNDQCTLVESSKDFSPQREDRPLSQDFEQVETIGGKLDGTH